MRPLSYDLFTSTSLFGTIPCFFFFNDTATTEIYTLSLHDALPIFAVRVVHTVDLPAVAPALERRAVGTDGAGVAPSADGAVDRKSTRLNSSHLVISYAVFCLKKKSNK